MWKSIKEYIPLSLGRLLGMTIGGIGAVGTVAGVLGYTLPNMELWVWLVVMFFGFSLAQFQVFHEVRVKRDELQEKLDDREGKKKKRETLGSFVNEGRQLMDSCQKQEASLEPRIKNWKSKVEQYISAEFDSSYVPRFYGDAGLFPTMISGSRLNSRLWSDMNCRVARLNEFIAEFKD